jgi:hypothetical protein
MADALAQKGADAPLVVIEIGELIKLEDATFNSIDAIRTLELIVELLGQKPSTPGDDALEFATSGRIESHGS